MVESDGAPLRALFGGLHVLAGERSTFIIRHYFFALSDPRFSLSDMNSLALHREHSFFVLANPATPPSTCHFMKYLGVISEAPVSHR